MPVLAKLVEMRAIYMRQVKCAALGTEYPAPRVRLPKIMAASSYLPVGQGQKAT
jgi:hypothetical protein